MPTVACPRCGKRLESDIYDDGNITTPSHMKTGLAKWCEAPVGPEGDPTSAQAGGSRRAAAARIDAALQERAQRSARAFAEEIERRRSQGA
jgi:hypothetical protein